MWKLNSIAMIGICVAIACAEAQAQVIQEVVLTLDVSDNVSAAELADEIDGLTACLNDGSSSAMCNAWGAQMSR